MNDRKARIRHVFVQISGITTAFRRLSADRLQNHFVVKRAAERVVVLVSRDLARLEIEETRLTTVDIHNTAVLIDRTAVSHLQLWDTVSMRFPRLQAELERTLHDEAQSGGGG